MNCMFRQATELNQNLHTPQEHQKILTNVTKVSDFAFIWAHVKLFSETQLITSSRVKYKVDNILSGMRILSMLCCLQKPRWTSMHFDIIYNLLICLCRKIN